MTVTRIALCTLVSLALTAPELAADQAVRRGSSTSSQGSAKAGPAKAGPTGTAARPAEPRSTPPAARPGHASSDDDQARRRPPGSSSTGTATRRTPPPSTGSNGSSGSSAGASRGTATTRVTPPGSGSRGGNRATGPARSSALRGTYRDREGRPVTGRAVARDTAPGFDLPLFGPWGRWFPYYGTGFGPSFGFVSFNPWGLYGATRWNWYRHGYWYDPYGYYPFGWDPYYPGSGYGYGSYTYSDERSEAERNMGSIRLKASPKEARVYIDGALVGTVDDFDGLSDHLKLAGGTYALELRADGYETYTGELVVEAEKTLTERVSLKKIR